MTLKQGAVSGQIPGTPQTAFVPFQKGWLWQFAHASNVVYGYWKITGSSDAALRITAEWQWVLGAYAGSEQQCGAGTTNTASDDAAWTTAFLLQAYEVTGDPVALSHAKGLLDCTWARWSDNGTANCYNAAVVGAGIWYDDTCALKSSYQNVFALDNYWYYQISGDVTYRTRAIDLDAWIASNLQRSGQTKFGTTYPNDGLYWVTLNANGTISGTATPYRIQPGSSVVLLAADMAEAVLCARLYADTGSAAYLSRAQATARGIRAYQTVASGAAFSARDARVDGWAAVLYAREVAPLVTSDATAFGVSGIAATGTSVMALDRGADNTFSGSWYGPANGADVWSQAALPAQQIEMTANAVIWVIAALANP